MSAGSTGIANLAQAAVLAYFVAIPANDVWADGTLDAKAVMTKMGSDERFGFITGLVEGLAYARYLADGNKPDGMKCIQSWFYDGSKESLSTIYDAFDKYPEHAPANIIAALARKQCG
jgi:hypothetical protein